MYRRTIGGVQARRASDTPLLVAFSLNTLLGCSLEWLQLPLAVQAGLKEGFLFSHFLPIFRLFRQVFS